MAEKEKNTKDENEVKTENVEKETEVIENDIEKELDELNDRYKRLFAEFENYKKRNMKERESLRNMLTSDIMMSILPIIDNLEKAISTGTKDKAYEEGIKLVLKQLKDAFSKINANQASTWKSMFKLYKNTKFNQEYLLYFYIVKQIKYIVN